MNIIDLNEYDDGVWEISELGTKELKELDDYLNVTAIPLSQSWKEFHKVLKKSLASIDMPRAG